jgi:hypothetical protein
MEMGPRKEIERIEPQEELYRCPSCDYSDGFHVSFKVGKMDKKAEVYLICPNCHGRFRMGWKVSMSP